MKSLLLAAIPRLLFIVLRGRHSVRMQAGKRVGLVSFALINVYAVRRPDDVASVVKWLGVGRATDLLLYGLVLAFVLGMLNHRLRFQGFDRRRAELARTLACARRRSAAANMGTDPARSRSRCSRAHRRTPRAES